MKFKDAVRKVFGRLKKDPIVNKVVERPGAKRVGNRLQQGYGRAGDVKIGVQNVYNTYKGPVRQKVGAGARMYLDAEKRVGEYAGRRAKELANEAKVRAKMSGGFYGGPVRQKVVGGAKEVKRRAKDLANEAKVRAKMSGGFMGYLAARGIGGGLRGIKGGAKWAGGKVKQELDKDSKNMLGSVFAFGAIILWIFDLLEWGGIYSGFNLNPQDFWSNWLRNFTFRNIWFDLTLTLIIIYIVYSFMKDKKLPDSGSLVSRSLFIFTMLFFATNLGWTAYPKAVLHLFFIIGFGLVYVRQITSTNAALLTIVGLLFFDFFLFSTVLRLVPLFKYISLLGAIIIFWTFAQTPSTFTAIFFVLLVILIMVLTVAEGLPDGGVFFEESDDKKAPISELMDKWGEGISNYQKQVSSTLEARINYAITGQVEENQYEPLGVYLENVQSSDTRYDEDEDVVVWGTVKARTLDDPIKIKVGCYAKDEKNEDYVKVDPSYSFDVFASEELDFACTFDGCYIGSGCWMEPGSNVITTYADFNFETLAYLKMYFINNERKRAMIREGLDIFKEFDIKDKTPVPVYTNGPVAIEMGTSSSLVGVSDIEESIVNPRFTISIENRPEWKGKITGLNELVLLLPNGVTIESVDNEKEKPDDEKTRGDCNRMFKNYENQDCKDSCDVDNKVECEKQCELLLGGENPQYVGYNMTEIDKFQDDETQRFKRFNCKITPNMTVLGNTPITTKYIRVKAKYDYRVEETIIVKIDKLSGDYGTSTESKPTSVEKFLVTVSAKDLGTGKPLEEVKISISGDDSFSVHTDANGNVEFELERGDYHISAGKLGQDITIQSEGKTVEFKMEALDGKFTVAVSATHFDAGYPIKGVTIYIRGEDRVFHADTDEEGKTQISVENGVYHVSAEKSDYGKLGQDITIQSEGKTVEFDMKLDGGPEFNSPTQLQDCKDAGFKACGCQIAYPGGDVDFFGKEPENWCIYSDDVCESKAECSDLCRGVSCTQGYDPDTCQCY